VIVDLKNGWCRYHGEHTGEFSGVSLREGQLTMSTSETTPPWLMVDARQLKQGWMETRGVVPVHHEFIVLEELPGGQYKVRNPALWLLEHPVEGEHGR
jgi:hypothetical protein